MLGAVAPAAARSRAIAVDRFEAGPVVAEPWVVFARESRGRTLLLAVLDEGRVRRLGGFDPLLNQGRARDRIVALDGSPGRVAVGFSLEELAQGESGFDFAVPLLGQVLIAPVDGRVRSIVRCRNQVRPPGSVALAARFLAYAGPGCDRARFGVRDLARSSTRAVARPAGRLRAAGSFVANARGRRVEVYDAASGKSRYVVDVPAVAGAVGPPQFDIQDDGTLAATVVEDVGCRVWVWAPDGAQRGPLPYRPDCGAAIRLDDGRLLFDEFVDARTARLVLGTLSGDPSRAIGPVTPAAAREALLPTSSTGIADAGTDLDGERFAYAEPACLDARVVFGTLDAFHEPEPLESCPVSVKAPKRVRVDSRGRFAVRVRCDNGCEAAMTLREDTDARREIRNLGENDVRVSRGARGRRIVLRVGRRERRSLQRRGRLRIVVTVQVLQPDDTKREASTRLTLLPA